MRALIFILPLILSGCVTNQDLGYVRVSSDSPVATAANYIGYTERTHRAELREFTGVDPVRTEWCAAFVNSVLNESGIAGSESVSDTPLMARSFLNWGIRVNEQDVEPGDLVVFPRGNQGWQGHVGFFIREAEINGKKYYYILGGNQSNMVSIEMYPANRALGIRRQSSI